MTDDPLHPKPVTPLGEDTSVEAETQDARPFWLRLLGSIRPTANVEVRKRDGKRIETVGISGKADF